MLDMLVELGNQNMAKVLELTPEHVILDANDMLAGLERSFQVEVLTISRNNVLEMNEAV